MGRKISGPVTTLVIIGVLLVVVAVFYFQWFAQGGSTSTSSTYASVSLTKSVSFPVATSTRVASSATSTTTTTSTLSFSPLLYGPLVSGITGQVLAVVESSTEPLIDLITQSSTQAGLANDSFIKVGDLWILLSFAKNNSIIDNERDQLWDKEFDIIGDSTYLNDLNLAPGQVIDINLSGCALYNGWPNFLCTDDITIVPYSESVATTTFASWIGENGAMISLADASLYNFPATSTLFLDFNIHSGYGEFCPSSLTSSTLGVVRDERGDISSPLPAFPGDNTACIGPNTTSTMRVGWEIFASTTPITVQVLDVTGAHETFFDIYPLPNGTLFIQNAP